MAATTAPRAACSRSCCCSSTRRRRTWLRGRAQAAAAAWAGCTCLRQPTASRCVCAVQPRQGPSSSSPHKHALHPLSLPPQDCDVALLHALHPPSLPPQDCDVALLRRFDRRIHVPLPGPEARAAFFQVRPTGVFTCARAHGACMCLWGGSERGGPRSFTIPHQRGHVEHPARPSINRNSLPVQLLLSCPELEHRIDLASTLPGSALQQMVGASEGRFGLVRAPMAVLAGGVSWEWFCCSRAFGLSWQHQAYCTPCYAPRATLPLPRARGRLQLQRPGGGVQGRGHGTRA